MTGASNLHESSDSDESWPRGWDEHKDAQLRRLAMLPFPQKLEWLEDAQALAEKLAQARGQQSNPRDPLDH